MAGYDHQGGSHGTVHELEQRAELADEELAAAKQQLIEQGEREESLAAKNAELEGILSKVSGKNRQLQAKLASLEDSLSSSSDRIAELQDVRNCSLLTLDKCST